MTCPQCEQRLTLREYAWDHRHPTPTLRKLGAALMAVGAVEAVVGLALLTR